MHPWSRDAAKSMVVDPLLPAEEEAERSQGIGYCPGITRKQKLEKKKNDFQRKLVSGRKKKESQPAKVRSFFSRLRKNESRRGSQQLAQEKKRVCLQELIVSEKKKEKKNAPQKVNSFFFRNAGTVPQR